MKNILKHIFPVSAIINLIKTDKETWLWFVNLILTILFPLIFVTTLMTIMTLVGSFILWKTPNHMYFPFVTGGEMQSTVDRMLLFIGIVLSIFKKDL